MRRVAAQVRAGLLQNIAQEMNQQKPRLDLRFARGSVQLHPDSHRAPPARSIARFSARLVNSLTNPVLYSAGPRRSELGCASSEASCAACPMFSALGALPRRKSSARFALIGTGPTFVNPIPTFANALRSLIVTCA